MGRRRNVSKKYPIEAGSAESSQDALATQNAKNEAAIRLLRSWREGDEQEQRETWECLKRALDEDRLSYRRRFQEFSK